MNYAKVENGQIIQIGLPLTGILNNGSTVSGYNLLDINILKNEGWLPLTENKPTYDNTTQYIEFVDYTINTTEVVANYIVKDIPIVVPQPTEIELLQQENTELKNDALNMAEILLDLGIRVQTLEGV